MDEPTRSGVSPVSIQRGAASCLAAAALGPRFTPHRLLGSGGMGVVVAAHDHALGRTVAVKTLFRAHAASPIARARLRAEAERHRGLRVPGLVEALDVCETPSGAPCLVLEPIERVSLREAAGPLGPRMRAPVSRVLAWLADVAGTLAALHARGVVHLDVKPDNVLVDAHGRTHVIDLGLASAPYVPALDGRGAPGTPPYIAPEVFFGPAVDARADQFALAVTALELLTGRSPIAAGETTGLAPAPLGAPVPRLAVSRPELGAALDETLARATMLGPDARFPTIEPLRWALREAAVAATKTSHAARAA